MAQPEQFEILVLGSGQPIALKQSQVQGRLKSAQRRPTSTIDNYWPHNSIWSDLRRVGARRRAMQSSASLFGNRTQDAGKTS